jgi:exodeoxyribonuclease VII small subunit
MPKNKEQNFETSIAQLEKIVAQLESGDLPLERALDLFEEGVGLSRRCQAQLEEAERKVEVLLKERGEIKTVPFGSFSKASLDPLASGEETEAELPSLKPVTSSEKAQASADAGDDLIPF